jgi:hypothetical protein
MEKILAKLGAFLTLAVTADVDSLSFLTTETGYRNEPGR